MRTVLGLSILGVLSLAANRPAVAGPGCGCPATLCEVTNARQLKACGQARAAIRGTVERFAMRKGKHAPWQATGLFLADGTRIVVTYGEPPAQWDRFVGKRVCVRAKVVPGSPLHESSVNGPHLSEWDFPVLAGGDMSDGRGEKVTLTGTAQNAKGGAVLVDGDKVYYLAGVDSWPDEVHGKKVQVTGVTTRRQYLPEARQAKDGAWSQGAVGQQDVIDAPTWKLAK